MEESHETSQENRCCGRLDEFGVLQIVDIALKAISPAVNDPTTAISCVDQLSRILIRYGVCDMKVGSQAARRSSQ